MILRDYQERAVDACLAALRTRRNTLLVSPTGAGKTVMLSAIAQQHGGRVLVLQHRGELVRQNRATYQRLNPSAATDVYTATRKMWSSGATFAMVQTLNNNVDRMPRFDIVVADEAHHSTAASWRRILDAAREKNPQVSILGVTATPNRGDRKGLRAVFDNVADQVTVGELIAGGHLVPPRAFVVDVGVTDELAGVKKSRGGEYDLGQAAEVLEPATAAIIKSWRDKAGDRPTVAFCSNVAHAESMTDAFNLAGVRAVCVTGKTPDEERQRRLNALRTGEAQVIVNVAVATEGWDEPLVSCVMLCRPSSFKSTMIQMIGRGLRILDPAVGIKKDCIVLDYGRSLLTHGGIEQIVDLEEPRKGQAPRKPCPECEGEVPLSTMVCPLCGYEWPAAAREVRTLEELRMVEYDLLLNSSPFAWWDGWNDRVVVATAFDVWAIAHQELDGTWWAFGGAGQGAERVAKVIGVGDRLQAVAAGDRWMRDHGDRRSAGKARDWLFDPPSFKQQKQLYQCGVEADGLSKYEAACCLTLKFNKRHILKLRAGDLQEAA